MATKRKVLVLALVWIALVSGLHLYLNVNWASMVNDYLPPKKRKFTVAYIPVTCHLACPVTDYISKFSRNGEIFLPKMFQGFPEIKEALISNKVQAAFIFAPPFRDPRHYRMWFQSAVQVPDGFSPPRPNGDGIHGFG